MIQARRADWAAGTCYSFAVLPAEPGVPGDLVGSVSIRGLNVRCFPTSPTTDTCTFVKQARPRSRG